MVEPASSGTSPPSSGGGITQSPGNSNHVYLSDGTFLDFDELFDSAKQAAQSTPATSPVRQQESDYSPPMDASFINNSNRTADERELMTFVDQVCAPLLFLPIVSAAATACAVHITLRSIVRIKITNFNRST
jgi:hypothetical protein